MWLYATVLCAIATAAGDERRPSSELLQFMDPAARRPGSLANKPSHQGDTLIDRSDRPMRVSPWSHPGLASRAGPAVQPPAPTAPSDGVGANSALKRFLGGLDQGAEQPRKARVRAPQQARDVQQHRVARQHDDADTQQVDDVIYTNCDLRSIDARTITQSDFRERYQGREPILLAHAADTWPATTSWATPSRIAAAHGDVELQLQDPLLLAQKGSFAPVLAATTLLDYMEGNLGQEKPFFRNRWHYLTDKLLADVNFSDVPTRSVRSHHIVSLGGAGTGVGFHSHAESWLAQIQGRKHWSLARSLGPGWQTKHGCEWISSAQPNGDTNDDNTRDEPWYLEMMGLRKKPLYQCIVGPGDAIYIPTGWYHATCNLDSLTLALGGQGEVGDVAGHAAFITAILDNDEIQAKRLLAGSTKESRLMMLQSQLHSGQSAVHISVMFNRVWALKLLRQQGVDLSVPLRCNTHGHGPEMNWRHGTPADHRGCGLLGSSPWFDETSVECNSHGVDCRGAEIPVLYLATRYGALDALQYLTAHVQVLPIQARMRVVVAPASTTTAPRVSRQKQPVAGVEGWINVAHVACAYGERQILEWSLNSSANSTQSSTTIMSAERRAKARPESRMPLDLLLLSDPTGRLPIHYCASSADDPQLLRALLSSSSERRIAQLEARDHEGNTAEDLLSSRILKETHQSRRGSRNAGKQHHHQKGDVQDLVQSHSSNRGPRWWLDESLRVIKAAAADELTEQWEGSPTEDGPNTARVNLEVQLGHLQRGRAEL